MFLFELPRNGRNHLLSVCCDGGVGGVCDKCVSDMCVGIYIIKPSFLFLFFFSKRENKC